MQMMQESNIFMQCTVNFCIDVKPLNLGDKKFDTLRTHSSHKFSIVHLMCITCIPPPNPNNYISGLKSTTV